MNNSQILNPARDLYHRLQWLADYNPKLLLPVSESAMMMRLIRRVQPRKTEHELIRVGPANDGGYLIPNDLDGIGGCFSPGVNNQIDFDLDIARRGIRVHMADASVAAPEGMVSNMTFEPMFVGAEDHGSVITMDTWVEKAQEKGDHDLMLQMDIEGSEYEVIASMSSALMALMKRTQYVAAVPKILDFPTTDYLLLHFLVDIDTLDVGFVLYHVMATMTCAKTLKMKNAPLTVQHLL